MGKKLRWKRPSGPMEQDRASARDQRLARASEGPGRAAGLCRYPDPATVVATPPRLIGKPRTSPPGRR